MSAPEYRWRQLTPRQRVEVLAGRKLQRQPWHSPPHRANFGDWCFHVTAACFEHRPFIGHHPERMDAFARDLLAVFAAHASQTFAWCVLPNHYHAQVEAADILRLLRELGKLHGRTSHAWNGEEHARGRQVFFRSVERAMRSERHYWATLNYVHHNPVHHGYVERWTDCSGVARRNTSRKPPRKKPGASGTNTHCATTAKAGTTRSCDARSFRSEFCVYAASPIESQTARPPPPKGGTPNLSPLSYRPPSCSIGHGA